jgi:hypothetical protein
MGGGHNLYHLEEGLADPRWDEMPTTSWGGLVYSVGGRFEIDVYNVLR